MNITGSVKQKLSVLINVIMPALAAGLALCLVALPIPAWPSYIYTELLPPAMSEAHAHAINNSGTVAGDGVYLGTWQGFLYKDGSYDYLMPSGWTESYAFGINDRGEVAGFGSDGVADMGFVCGALSCTELLPPGWTWAEAYDINDSGAVVGYGSDVVSDKGFLYKDGAYTELIPPGWTEAYAYDINDSGEIAGLGHDMGFIYSGGVYTELLPPGWDYLFAWIVGIKINNSGTVVGNGYDGVTWKGFLYDNGGYAELFPAGWSYAFANDINDVGTVVGWGNDGAGGFKGFVVDTCSALPARIRDGLEYDSLQAAYDASSSGNVIMGRAVALSGDLFIDLSKTVTLEGGYDCGYASKEGVTTLRGNMMISDGRLTIAGGTFELR